MLKSLESFCFVFLDLLQFPILGCPSAEFHFAILPSTHGGSRGIVVVAFPARSRNCDSLESFCRFRSRCVHGSDHWQEVQMLLVLDDASKIDAGEQTYEPSDAFNVVGLKVTPDAVCCFQDGLSLLGVLITALMN